MKQELHELQFSNMPRNAEDKTADLRIGDVPETLALDEKLCAELSDVEANESVGKMFLPRMYDAREKR